MDKKYKSDISKTISKNYDSFFEMMKVLQERQKKIFEKYKKELAKRMSEINGVRPR